MRVRRAAWCFGAGRPFLFRCSMIINLRDMRFPIHLVVELFEECLPVFQRLGEDREVFVGLLYTRGGGRSLFLLAVPSMLLAARAEDLGHDVIVGGGMMPMSPDGRLAEVILGRDWVRVLSLLDY